MPEARMGTSLRHVAGAAALAILLVGSRAPAQSSSIASRFDGPQNGWISASFGEGGNPGSSSVLAGTLAGWYSAGSIVGGVRAAGVSPLYSGESVDDIAALAGLRTSGRRAFLLGALGYASVHSYHTCECSPNPSRDDPRVSGLAYSLQALANIKFIGIGAEYFGAVGPGRASMHALALSLQLGWFGP